ncbi:MAG TPA: hypothetical protein VFX59_06300 [Polyangiales bacterium]|nr:hypothetical protein [Polyangiales bacterium]
MIQAPRKSNGIELGYEQEADPHEASAALELARLHAQLRQVREWADRGEWRESGSDGLYAILSESGERALRVEAARAVSLRAPQVARR